MTAKDAKDAKEKRSMKSLLISFASFASLAVNGVYAAQAAPAYPTKPIRIIATTTPGSGPDIVARLLGQKLTEAWGQPVVVDPRPGASGMIGAEIAARASADGYTFMIATGPTLPTTSV